MNDTPYDIMVGIWIGAFAIFNSKGDHITAGPSRYKVYWKTPGSLMHFQQDGDLEAAALFGGRADEVRMALPSPFAGVTDVIRKLALPNYVLTVQGKYATGSGGGLDVVGAETTPDVYQFELKVSTISPPNILCWYNTHIFPSPNERQTIGPVVNLTNSELGLIMVHSYRRISSYVPLSEQQELNL